MSDLKPETEMRAGFEAQRKVGTNVDWFTWQIAWHDALFTMRDIPGEAAGQDPVVLSNDELNALTKERFGNMHSQYAEGFRRLLRNAIEANDKKARASKAAPIAARPVDDEQPPYASDPYIDNMAVSACVAGDGKGRLIFTIQAARKFARDVLRAQADGAFEAAPVAVVEPTIDLSKLQWLDTSIADPVEKARRVLGHLITPDAVYFHDDGFPRCNTIASQAACVLAVLNAYATLPAPIASEEEAPVDEEILASVQSWIDQNRPSSLTDERIAIDDRYREVMNALAHALNETLGALGFALLVFEHGKVDGGRVNYIGNCDRVDMLAAMREFLARNEVKT